MEQRAAQICNQEKFVRTSEQTSQTTARAGLPVVAPPTGDWHERDSDWACVGRVGCESSKHTGVVVCRAGTCMDGTIDGSLAAGRVRLQVNKHACLVLVPGQRGTVELRCVCPISATVFR